MSAARMHTLERWSVSVKEHFVAAANGELKGAKCLSGISCD